MTARYTAILRRYRQATDYPAAAQIYLRDNVLLREPLAAEHFTSQLLGHRAPPPAR
ncbi:MAG: hypothetical protein WD794_14645 [Mycobacteriales bacterium]